MPASRPPFFLSLSLFITLTCCFSAMAQTSAVPQDAPASSPQQPKTVMRYTNPAAKDGENYGMTVLRRGPAFTKEELLRYCDDVYPVAGKNPQVMLRYMVSEKGWESDRVYYMMARLIAACHVIQAGDEGKKASAGQEDIVPGANELQLARSNYAHIPAALGGGRDMGNAKDPAYLPLSDADLMDPFASEEEMKAVLAANPEFTEEELLKALNDIAGDEKLTTNVVVDNMRKAGWKRNRAFYLVFRIRVSNQALTNKKTRKAFQKEMPLALPTTKEEAIMKKYQPQLKAAQFIRTTPAK